ncbi:hypothetical protein ACEWY4_017142 [Coilia grayii]|uniref:CCHC-type domain-containing protein n=1 Tax=Coilia grayii TaxID=363190 RepID=A0ABD1JG05_9TELE
MAELQQLRDRVEELQAENERLLNARGDGAQSGQHGQTLYIPRERRCPKFSGRSVGGSLSIEEWVEEAESCIRSRHMSNHERAMFLYDHLEGEARNEIKYRPTATREDPAEIVKVLREVYGCAKSYVLWQQRFFDRKQKDNESLFEFSHALMELMEKIKMSKSNCITNPDLVLRDQFCENVNDSTLRRELKKLVRDNAEWTILDVRREATRWVEEGQTGRDRSHRTVAHNSEVQYTSQCEATLTQTSELAELKDLVLKQQAQIDMLVKHLSQPHTKPPASQRYGGGRYRRAPDGRPICIKCEQPGHIARYCQASRSLTSQPTPPPSSGNTSTQPLPPAANTSSLPLN